MNIPYIRSLRTLGPLLLLAGTGGCGMVSQGHNVQGTRLYQQGNYPAAVRSFQQAAANDPQNADAYYNLAASFHRMAKLSGDQAELAQAEHLYNQCLDRDPNHTDCYRGLAVLLVEQGRSDAALRLLEGWVTQSPTNADAKIELARLMDEFGNRDAAKARLLEALALEPENARALTALGKLREQSGETMQAIADYQRSLAANRFQPQVASRLASLQTAVGGAAIAPPRVAPDTRVVQEPLGWSRY